MPQLISVFLVVVLGMSEAIAGVLAPVLLSIGASLVLGQVAKMFQKGPSASSLSSQSASRTITSRQGFEE